MFFDIINTIDCSLVAVVARKSVERFATKHKNKDELLYRNDLCNSPIPLTLISLNIKLNGIDQCMIFTYWHKVKIILRPLQKSICKKVRGLAIFLSAVISLIMRNKKIGKTKKFEAN
jgi:hypothetical protein